MNKEQQKILAQFDDSTLFEFLRQVRNKAFISWSTTDVIERAKEIGFEMMMEDAVTIIANIDRKADCTIGITWDTIDYFIGEWIEDNSFEVVIEKDSSGEEVTTKFCALTTNDNIEDYWNDDNYYFYGISKDEVKNHIENKITIGDINVIKVI